MGPANANGAAGENRLPKATGRAVENHVWAADVAGATAQKPWTYSRPAIASSPQVLIACRKGSECGRGFAREVSSVQADPACFDPAAGRV